MRDSGILALRLSLGGYLATHGAQKLFGTLGGAGLDTTATHFHHMGLRPGKAMAALAGSAELAGGLLTAAGLADPIGPVAIAGAMTVAATVHSEKGPLSTKGGFELPLSNLAAALALAATGPGRFSVDALLGRRVPPAVVKLVVTGGAALTVYSAVGVVRAIRQRTAQAAAPSEQPAGEEAAAARVAPATSAERAG